MMCLVFFYTDVGLFVDKCKGGNHDRNSPRLVAFTVNAAHCNRFVTGRQASAIRGAVMPHHIVLVANRSVPVQ